MSEGRKTLPRRSLRSKLTVQIIAVGVAAVLLSAGIILIASSFFLTMSAKKNSQKAYMLLSEMLHNEREYFLDEQFSFEEMIKNGDDGDPDFQESLEHIRKAMEAVCKAYSIDYLYIFDVDEADNSIIYYVVAAFDQDAPAKQKIFKERSYGKVVSMDDDPKTMETMLAAKAGDTDTRINLISNEYGAELSWSYPVFDKDGNVVVLLGMDYNLNYIFRFVAIILLAMSCFIVLFTAFVLLVVRRMMTRQLLVPIMAISGAMDQFVNDYSSQDRSKLQGFDLSGVIKRDDKQDEIDDIADSFQKMSADIDSYIKDVNALTAERMEVEAQMELTKHVQDGIVPESVREETSEYAIYATAEPAKMFGGDFYDFFINEDGRLVFFIGDVSGKGINAAMFMVMVKTALREKLGTGMEPADALNALNDEVCAHNPEGMFATIFAGILDLKTGEISFSNAGHERPLVFVDEPYYQNMDTGIAIGLFEDAGIIGERMRLAPNTGILLYTDGVTEAVSPSDELFGSKRLLAYASDVRDIDEAAAKLKNTINSFYGNRERFDDLTFMVVFYK